MINRIAISFSVGLAFGISSCGNLNYGTPHFASSDLQINADSLDATSDFKRLFNTAYSDSAEFNAIYSIREKDSLEKSEFTPPKNPRVQPIKNPINSESKTVIYAETVNVYYGTNQNDSVVIVKRQDSINSEYPNIVELYPQNKSTPIKSTKNISDSLVDSLSLSVEVNKSVAIYDSIKSTSVKVKDELEKTAVQPIKPNPDSLVLISDSLSPNINTKKEIPVSDSTKTPSVKVKDKLEKTETKEVKKSENTDRTNSQKDPQKTIVKENQTDVTIYETDTIHSKVYINDTVRSVVTIDPKNTKKKDEVVSPPKPTIINKTDTVYQTKVITKIEKQNLPRTKVSDTVYIREIDTVFQSDVLTKLEKLNQNPSKVSDTIFIKETDTIYQTKTDTVRIQEIKEVLSKPVIIEKKPRIELFTITFQKNTTKGDNFDKLSEEILAICDKNKNYLIFLSAYTDKSGSESYNYAISQKRATSIRDQLIAKGIDKTKIVTQWFGEEFATQENSSSERVVKVRIELSE